jgi:hypothetical protein
MTLSALITGCASSRSPESSQGPLETPDRFSILIRSDAPVFRTVLPVPLDQAWEMLPAVYRELGYPGAPASNTRDHVYITPNMAIRGRLYPGEHNSNYLDCGTTVTGARADMYEVHFVMITRLRAGKDGETVVETVVDGRARDRSVSGTVVPCTGAGKLEKAVADLLRRKLYL